MADREPSRKAAVAGILIGIGMGGLMDGIVLHQILQWHNMVSNWFPPTTMEAMRFNMMWDGIFHAVVWVVTLTGILLLWSEVVSGEAVPSLRSLVGRLVFGWGSFNLVEGLVNHQLLGLHYVRQVPDHAVYNLMFLAVGGTLFILIGWMLMRAERR